MSAVFKVESDVPPPVTLKMALKSLAVGQSIFVLGTPRGTLSSYAAREVRLCPEKNFTSRAQDGGVRIWRLA